MKRLCDGGPANNTTPLEDADAKPCLGKVGSRGQTVVPSADDRDIAVAPACLIDRYGDVNMPSNACAA